MAARAAAAPAPAAKGETIEVQPGDTLYGIAKKHNVAISELMSVNGLKSPVIKPGQKLSLPAAGSGPAPAPVHRVAAAPAVAAAAPAGQAAVAEAPPAGDWSGSYTVKQGDSLYAIAHRVGVKPADLQRANGIADASKLRPGTVIKVPGEHTVPAAIPVAAASAGLPTTPAPAALASAPPAAGARTDITIINGGSREATPVAEAEPAAGTPPVVKAGVAMKLRWPAQGRILQGFGPRPDGTHNDGVDVAVPAGTDVLAAEAGTVAYAGSEVRTYGNLVLIRHDNGWVTAYAYNERILVQRGDRVRRGQPIAKAGHSGVVAQPEVHFEVRVDAKPVDPVPYLEKM